MLNANNIYSEGGIFNEVDYYHWLLERAGATQPPYLNYLLLLQTLHKRDYIWSVQMNTNRVQDAFQMRNFYALSNGIFPPVDSTGEYPAASVLEVLLALSYRCEEDIMGEPGKDHPARWFWMMMQNLDLMKNDDEHFDHIYVDQRLTDWLEGRYKRNGQGSPFPLMNPKGDQRKKELWQQMLEWLNENYCSVI